MLEECRQFTLAAQRCNLTQSAFSQLIVRLEEQVGMRLFDRDTRSVRLTAEGKLFAIKAREILKHIGHAMQDMEDYVEKRQGRLAFAIVPSLAASWAPSLLERYHKSYSGISLEIFDTYSERCLQLVRESKAEFAVAAQPGDHGEFKTTTLFEESFYLVCSRLHAPKQSGSITLSELSTVPVIHLIHTEGIRALSDKQMHQLRPMLRSAGVKDVGIEVEHATTLAGLIRQGFGCGIVPHSMIGHFMGKNVIVLPFSRRSIRRPIFLVHKHSASLSPAATAFIELMKAYPPKNELDSE